jgi:hypothetical protein
MLKSQVVLIREDVEEKEDYAGPREPDTDCCGGVIYTM